MSSKTGHFHNKEITMCPAFPARSSTEWPKTPVHRGVLNPVRCDARVQPDGRLLVRLRVL